MSSRFHPLPLVPVRAGAAAIAVCLTISVPGSALAQTTAVRNPAVIQSVDVAPLAGGAGAGVAVHADGPLPVPTVGVLDGPPRIYLDFAGVRLPSGMTTQVEGPLLRGVRLAQRTPDPLVARIVLDLLAPVGHRIDTSQRQAGKVVVILENVAQDAAVAPERPARPTDAERYLSRISPMVARLHALRRVVADVDRQVAGPDSPGPALAAVSLDPNAALAADGLDTSGHTLAADGLDTSGHTLAADELDTLGRALAAVTAPASLATTRDLLMRYCALGSRAIRMRDSSMATGDTAGARNAGSAAAGALIVLDRASRDLGYTPPR
jgi:hypothetical protein